MVRNRSDVCFHMSWAEEDDTVARMAACSGSSSEASIFDAVSSVESPEKIGGSEGCGFARARH